VHVVCPQGADRDRERHLRLDGVELYRYPPRPASGSLIGYLGEYAWALWKTWGLLREISRTAPLDVIQICNPPDVMILAAAPFKRRGTKIIFDHHDLVPELYLSRFGRGLLYSLTKVAERLTFALADVVIATNNSYGEIAVERGRKNPADVFVVRNAPPPDRFVPRTPDSALKQGARYLIAYAGVMGPQDGVDHGLRALAALKARRHDWHAVFAGSGDMLTELERMSEALGLAGVVEFTGWLDDERLLSLLSTADICLVPDPRTPLSERSTLVKVAEYMSLGRPVVAYDLAETRVTAGAAAVYVPPDDPVALARAIDDLLNDDARRAEMGRVGRDRVTTELSWTRSSEQLLAAYNHAVSVLPGRDRP
jgi:glycosyltransferase involved in cell wall biosynthesis